jgi:hypothetical protein
MADRILPWFLGLARQTLARLVNMPEPLMNTTGAFVFAQVQSFESNVGKTLCALPVLRHFRNWLREDF